MANRTSRMRFREKSERKQESQGNGATTPAAAAHRSPVAFSFGRDSAMPYQLEASILDFECLLEHQPRPQLRALGRNGGKGGLPQRHMPW